MASEQHPLGEIQSRYLVDDVFLPSEATCPYCGRFSDPDQPVLLSDLVVYPHQPDASGRHHHITRRAVSKDQTEQDVAMLHHEIARLRMQYPKFAEDFDLADLRLQGVLAGSGLDVARAIYSVVTEVLRLRRDAEQSP